MAFLERGKVVAPTAERKTEPMASLGGDVIVRSRMLADRMALSSMQESIKATLPNESEEDALVRVGSAVVVKTLSLQVILEDGQPVFTEEQWALHGAAHPDEVLHLYHVCQGMSGVDVEAAKKNSKVMRSDGLPSRLLSGLGARLKNLGCG